MGIETNDVFWLKKVPTGWKIRRVKDLFDIKRGRVISKSDMVDNGQFPVYSAQTENNGIMGHIDSFDFEGDYLTWTTDGVYAGTVFRRSGKFNCTNVCGTLKLKEEHKGLVDLDFIFYVLKEAAPHYKRDDINGGKLMSNEMEDILLVFPDLLEEQRRIAKELKKKDDLIESLISELEAKEIQIKNYFNCMLLEMISGKGEKTAIENSFWLKSVQKGWKVHRIKDLFELTIGGLWGDEPQGEKDIGVLRVNNFNRTTNTVDFSKEITMRNFEDKNLEDRTVRKGDFLVEKSGGGENSPVGGFFLVEETPEQVTVFSNFINLARLSKEYAEYAPFLKYVFKTMYNLGVTKIFVKQTTGIQNLDFPELITEIVALPDLTEAKEIVKELDLLSYRMVNMLQLLYEKKKLLQQYKSTMIIKEMSK